MATLDARHRKMNRGMGQFLPPYAHIHLNESSHAFKIGLGFAGFEIGGFEIAGPEIALVL